MENRELYFQEIYKEFRPKILRYLKRIVGDTEAEDLTQETFIKVNQGLDNFRGESKLSTWIYRIATNNAIDRLRSIEFQHETTHEVLEEENEEEVREVWRGDEKPSLEQVLMHAEMVKCFENFVKKLSIGYKAVYVLSDLEGLTNSEIAEVLGLSLDVVKVRLHRGRRQLLQELKGYCKAEDWL